MNTTRPQPEKVRSRFLFLRQCNPDQHSPRLGAGLKSPTIPKLATRACGLPHPGNAAPAFSLRAFSPKLWTAPVQYAFESLCIGKGLALPSAHEIRNRGRVRERNPLQNEPCSRRRWYIRKMVARPLPCPEQTFRSLLSGLGLTQLGHCAGSVATSKAGRQRNVGSGRSGDRKLPFPRS